MDAYASDKEQVETLKKWIKENGASIATGVIIALGIVFGGKAWFAYQDGIAGQASDNYAAMMVAFAEQKNEIVQQKGGVLINNFSDSPYAALAALTMARVAVDNDDLATARGHLKWAMSHGKPEPVRETAEVRLIQLLVEDRQLTEARQLLDGVDMSGAFRAEYEELWGDYWVASGDSEQAAKAYRAALDASKPKSRNRLFLQLKLDDTGHALDQEEGSA